MKQLPQDCPHADVAPRGSISSFAAKDAELPQAFREWDAGWCSSCEHFVRREPGMIDWEPFMAGPDTPA